MGDGWTQFQNSLTLQSDNNANTKQSNNIVPVGHNNNQNMNSKIGGRKKYRGGNTNMPSPMNSSMPMNSMPMNSKTGGRKCKTGGRKRRTRGGNVLAQALVPGSLILMNNALGKYSRKSRNSR